MNNKNIAILSVALLITQPAAFSSAAGVFGKIALGALTGWGIYSAVNKGDIESTLQANIQKKLSQNKKELFKSIHPIGNAREVRVHEVHSQWRSQNPKTLKDLKGYSVVYTIYWSGPITADGYTKVESYFDADVDRFTQTRVLATNGTTKSDAMHFATEFLTGFVGGLGIN
jgi:hypothetical protein